MAIDYILALSKRPDRAALQRSLLAHGLRTIDGELMLGTHLSAWVSAETSRHAAVMFRVSKTSEPDDFDRELFGLVAVLLQQYPGDATLSFELELTLLARRGGQLYRGSSDRPWTEDGWRLAQEAFAARGMAFHQTRIDAEPSL